MQSSDASALDCCLSEGDAEGRWLGGVARTGCTCRVRAIAFNWTRQKTSNEILNQNFCMSRERERGRVSQWMMSRPDIVDVLTNVSPFEALTLTAANTAACPSLPLPLLSHHTGTHNKFRAIKTVRQCRSKATQSGPVKFTRAQLDHAHFSEHTKKRRQTRH